MTTNPMICHTLCLVTCFRGVYRNCSGRLLIRRIYALRENRFFEETAVPIPQQRRFRRSNAVHDWRRRCIPPTRRELDRTDGSSVPWHDANTSCPPSDLSLGRKV